MSYQRLLSLTIKPDDIKFTEINPNKIKRQITAALYQLLPKLVPGWRLVLIVKPKTAESERQTHKFLQELKQLLTQTEVLNGNS